jgi:ATP-dependent DNA helicase RecG
MEPINMIKAKQTTFNPADFMKIAIEEMKKSVSENRDDGKISPKVGAVVVCSDGTYETAYRGELREGDHAEYTLLERKLHNKRLDDGILFTTLEPCVKRNPPKRGCCKRVINARIKTVYVGIQDRDPTVAGEGIEYMEDHGVKVLMFDREYQQIIEEENMKYLKQAQQRAQQAKRIGGVTALKQVIPSSDISQFSEEALRKFLNEAKLSFEIDDNDFKVFLADLGALELEEKTNIFRPTGAGYLLFGKNPRVRFKQAVLKAYVDYGANKIEPKDFDQPLVLVPDLVEEWLNKSIPLSKDISTFKRKDIPDFPISILREAVVNALVHRDYSIEGAKSSLEIDNDKIVIKSPGAPVPSISLQQLNTFRAPSISRNPILTYVFNLMDYMEETGFGMRTFKEMTEKYRLPLPEYTFTDPFLKLTFPRSIASAKRISTNPALAKLNEEELLGYDYIKSKGRTTRKEYQEHFKFDGKKAERHLKKFFDLDLVNRKGSGPSTYYEII